MGNKKEAVTTSSLALDPLVLLLTKADIERIKKDKLYQKRLKQNPKLKDQIGQIGESIMKTIVTFSSDSSEAISRQWNLVFHIDDSTWNSWEISNVKSVGDMYSFTVTAMADDKRLLDDKRLDSYLVAGVEYSVAQEGKKVSESDVVESLINTGLSADKLVDILLSEQKEAEVPDDKDAESDAIDKVQSMLVKMLPMTKGLKLAKGDEAKLADMLSKAMDMMKGSGESKK